MHDHTYMSLSSRTIAPLAKPFEGGMVPSHATVEMIWTEAGAENYLPDEGNKVQRVLGGLKALQRRASDPLS